MEYFAQGTQEINKDKKRIAKKQTAAQPVVQWLPSEQKLDSEHGFELVGNESFRSGAKEHLYEKLILLAKPYHEAVC